MDQLACFVPGMLALGAMALHTADFACSQDLLFTCNFFNAASPTRLGPDGVDWQSPPRYRARNPFTEEGLAVQSANYKLRPETLESIFYAYRATGDPVYREWGWAIFEVSSARPVLKRRPSRSTASSRGATASSTTSWMPLPALGTSRTRWRGTPPPNTTKR